ncbi:protein-L-isoaspartate O-methyltransferase family protein [Bdellovibrio sp. HCB337]|uniref:protein-L-isoaspartate O-methyltransferase family protein n=1 Tax=Bdellovibrio sp. HCB337 TaxID=3394358 RepID=UPI0039A583FF
MEDLKKLQENLILKTRRFHDISDRIVEAFYKYPRHHFVPSRYSLKEAYIDSALPLYKKDSMRSTISQPSFVLYLLELLNLHEGQKVFEVGAGSGWNAALMSYLVGEQGLVVSMEIIPEVARSAKIAIENHDIKNVQVIIGDAGEGWAPDAPYDRMIFTAAAPSLPDFVSRQLQDGGKVIYVQEGLWGMDELQVLEKQQDSFTCVQRVPCHFVPMTGSTRDEPSKSQS